MTNSSSIDSSDSSDVTRLSGRSADQSDRPGKSVLPDEDVLSSRERLGDFRLIRQIGHGGMGVVYEAEQLSLSRKVAVKVLPFASMLNPQHRKRFHNEARAAATLDHPNIVPVYFVGEERGVHFYVRSTVSTQRSRHRDEYYLTVARLGAEAAEALEHAHQIGILHRDIKPGNLMVDTTGKLWITDFGLASIEHGETLTRTGGVVGTAAYMSPEQAADSHHVDNRSDIYSLGATLYEMLTLRKHRSDDATRTESNAGSNMEMMSGSNTPEKIPVDLETIVMKALSSEPSDRYNTALEMANDLRSYTAGREIKARRMPFAQRLSRILRRHRRLTIGAIAASFLLAASFGAIMWVYSGQLSEYAEQLEQALADAKQSRIYAEAQSGIAQE